MSSLTESQFRWSTVQSGVNPWFLLLGTTLSSNGPRLLAASLAALVAWRTRSALWTIGVGMGTLWLLQWLTSVI